jgi:hypothetical protein
MLDDSQAEHKLGLGLVSPHLLTHTLFDNIPEVNHPVIADHLVHALNPGLNPILASSCSIETMRT